MAMAAAEPAVVRTVLYDEHVRAGARIVEFGGFAMPLQYQGIVAEHQAVRTAAGIFDVSHMGRIEFAGPNALGLVQSLCSNDVKKAPLGGAVYTVFCREDGGILDDCIVYRASAERVLVVVNASNRAKMAAHFAEAAGGKCNFLDRSADWALIALQGPRAIATFAKLDGGSAATPPKPFTFVEAVVDGAPCIVARTGYTGEDGVEVFVPSSSARAFWRKLVDLGAVPCGLGARDTLRLEAALRLYGNDMDESVNPYEAGLGWTVKLDVAKGDFLGRAALDRAKAALRRRIAGIQMIGHGIARHGYPVEDGTGKPVGTVTSGGPSPTLGKNIGMAMVATESAAEGTALRVVIRDKRIEAVVVKLPFYKRTS